jgi:hypothetical protein
VEFTVGRETGKQVTDRAHWAPGNFAVPERELLLLETNPRFVEMNKLLLVLTVTLLGVSASVAQTPDSNQEAKLLALVKDVQAQQAQLAANQAKIEEKLTALSEAIRTARIYTKREK